MNIRINSYIKSLWDDYQYNDGSPTQESNKYIICPYCGQEHEPSEYIGENLLVVGSDVLNDEDYRKIEKGHCKRCSALFDVDIDIKFSTERIK